MQRRPEPERLYWRVIHSERGDEEGDPRALSDLVEFFAADTGRDHVRLLQPPERHPKGGWRLLFDLQAEDKQPLVEFLYAQGWLGVV